MTNFIKKIIGGKGNNEAGNCCGVEIKEVADASAGSCCGTDNGTSENSSCCGTESTTEKNSSCCG